MYCFAAVNSGEECVVVVKTIFKSPFPLIFSAISFTISLPTAKVVIWNMNEHLDIILPFLCNKKIIKGQFLLGLNSFIFKHSKNIEGKLLDFCVIVQGAPARF